MQNFIQNRPKLIIIILIVLVLGLGGSVTTSIMFYQKYNALKNPSAISEADLKKIVADIGKVLVLPTDETPTLATVSDPSKLKDQPFFTHAEAGDKVLIYKVNQKAVLWRPSSGKVIEVSAFNTNRMRLFSPKAPTPLWWNLSGIQSTRRGNTHRRPRFGWI